MNSVQEKKFLTVEGLKEFFGVSEATIYKWKRERALPHIKIGRTLRFDMDKVLEWFEQYENISED